MVSLPTYKQFSGLRLRDFSKANLHQFESWQYAGREWVGEGIIGFPFTEFLCPVQKPGAVGAVCLNLESLPAELSQNILAWLAIPLQQGSSRDEIESQFGAPVSVLHFVEDRETLVYRLGERDRYEASFTIHQRDGLIHLTMIKTTLLKR